MIIIIMIILIIVASIPTFSPTLLTYFSSGLSLMVGGSLTCT